MRLFLALALFLAAPAAAQPVPSADIPQPKIIEGRLGRAYAPLLAELRRGGLVLVFRHERTEPIGEWDYEPFITEQCERQRNLSSVGRESARAVGAAIRALAIPVGPIVASTYCRAIEHARLAFGGVHVKTPGLIGPDGKERKMETLRADLRGLIAEHANSGTNLVLIGHHGTIDAFTDRMLDEGDALILRPRAGAWPQILAHISAARWEEIWRDTLRLEIERKAETAR